MLASAPEQAWRLDAKVANFLFSTVPRARHERGFPLFPCKFNGLLFCSRHGLLEVTLLREILIHWPKIAEIEGGNLDAVFLFTQ